jgi:sulfite reductase alpha subunit
MVDEPKEVIEGKKILKSLEEGPWPSYVKETLKTRYPIALYGASLYLKRDLWTTGGYVSVPGVPTGILMRVTSRLDIGENANVVRIYIPSGNFVSTKMLNSVADFADKYGVGMVHALTTSSDFEIPGIPKEKIKDFAAEFRASGMEVGSTGDAFRNTTCCVGPALCEYANFDTLKMRDDFYDKFNDYAKYPTFPHKMKFKISGCPNDCVRASQKGDIAVIGSWEGSPEINGEELNKAISKDPKLQHDLVAACPTKAIKIDGNSIKIKAEDCIQCMECIRKVPGAILPGKDKKYKIFVGGKLRGKIGPFTAKALLDVKTEDEVFDYIDRIVTVYSENAAKKERLGDLISRIGMRKFIKLLKEKPDSKQVKDLRSNVFYSVTDEDREKIKKDLQSEFGGE